MNLQRRVALVHPQDWFLGTLNEFFSEVCGPRRRPSLSTTLILAVPWPAEDASYGPSNSQQASIILRKHHCPFELRENLPQAD